MKIKSYLLAPLCGAMALVVLGSCSDEQIVNGNDNGRPEGNGIVFGASANYIKKPGTKTAYGDYNDPSNPTSQEILWLADDRVEVWSPTSPSVKQVEYQITGIDAEDGGSAYLASYQGRNGLQWDKGSETQDFYAVYPSPASIENQEMVQEHNIRLEEGVLHGFIPTNQEYQFTRDASADGGWRCTPTMDWQYMVARTDDFPVPQDGTDGGVTLDFKPLVTTLEITLEGPSAPLAQMNIFAPEDKIIMGEFSCDLRQQDSWGEGFLPTCIAEQRGTVTNYITVNLYDTDGEPIALRDGEYLTINVFMLPTEQWTNLEIRLAGYNTAARTLQLDADTDGNNNPDTPISLSEHLKTRVKVKAPDAITGTNTWMAGLNDNVYISQLSIPGTANSCSYGYTGDNPEWYAAQTVDLRHQWDSGIRCFELKCPQVNGDLAASPIQCNRTDVGMTFGEAVAEIWSFVEENPSEFAMIIPSYESTAGHTQDGTPGAAGTFMDALNTFYTNHTSYNYVTYTPDKTLGEVRHSLMFIARITSEEDENVELAAPVEGVVIKGWGSLKDLWQRRGYNYPNWATNSEYNQSLEYLLLNGNTSLGFIPENIPKDTGENNFYHGTVRSDGTSSERGAYIQDWSRVSPESKNYLLYRNSSWGTDYVQYCYWPESYQEKFDDAWNTFMAAIKANAGDKADAFYINSLDGYFIDENIPLSYKPYVAGRTDRGGSWHSEWSYSYGDGGTAGNIAAFAARINEDFFNEIQRYGVTNIYGPMNLVLIDRVYQLEDGSDPGSHLPSTIINNNFRFPLVVKTTTNSFGDGGTSMGNGGSAIE
ncbi:MAG TPA: hypothetical protein IAA99_01655 [Candidatus Avibacteroides faecavium]|nr:hypothetical protein [Candidatus Avibacteroides faecavium]